MKYWTMETEQLLLHKSLQHPDTFLPDYISGPMDRDRDVNMALHTRAKLGAHRGYTLIRHLLCRWCYTHKCQNNVYLYTEHAPVKILELTFSNVIKSIFL